MPKTISFILCLLVIALGVAMFLGACHKNPVKEGIGDDLRMAKMTRAKEEHSTLVAAARMYVVKHMQTSGGEVQYPKKLDDLSSYLDMTKGKALLEGVHSISGTDIVTDLSSIDPETDPPQLVTSFASGT